MAKTRTEALAAIAILYPNTTPAPKPPPQPILYGHVSDVPSPSAQLTLFPDVQPGVNHAITH